MLAALVLSGGLGYGVLALSGRPTAPGFRRPWIYSARISRGNISWRRSDGSAPWSVRAKNRGFAVAYGAAVLWSSSARPRRSWLSTPAILQPDRPSSCPPVFWLGGRKEQRDEQNTAPSIFAFVVAAVGVVFIAAPVILLLFETMFLRRSRGRFSGGRFLMLSASPRCSKSSGRGWGRGILVLLFGLFAFLSL